MDHSKLETDIEKTALERLIQLKSLSSSCLDKAGVTPEQARDILCVIKDEVDTDEDVIQYLHDLADPNDPDDVYLRIDEAVREASIVFWRATYEISIIENAAYTDVQSVIDLCIELSQYFSNGLAEKKLGDEMRKEISSEAARRNIGNSNGGVISQKQRKTIREGQNYDEHDDFTDEDFIEGELNSLCELAEEVIYITREINEGSLGKSQYKKSFKIKKNNKLNKHRCADYLYEKYNVYPQELGRTPQLNLQHNTIYKKILDITSEDWIPREERLKGEQEMLMKGF